MPARRPLLQKHARPGLNPYIETLSGKRIGLMLIIQIRSDDNFRVGDNPGVGPMTTRAFIVPNPRIGFPELHIRKCTAAGPFTKSHQLDIAPSRPSSERG